MGELWPSVCPFYHRVSAYQEQETLMFNSRLAPLHAAALIAVWLVPPASAGTLFFNGDPNGGNIGGSFLDCSTCRSTQGVRIYDDFHVTGSTWHVTGLFGDYFMMSPGFLPTSGLWEIRQNVSQGNSGTLIAGGSAPLTLTPMSTPPNGSASFHYFGISLDIAALDLAPGTYWMNLAPDALFNETFLVGTEGANGVAPLIDGASFVIGTYWPSMQSVGGYLNPFTGHSQYDFAYGVIGTAEAAGTPEPASALLLGSALAGVFLSRRQRTISATR
jgi:hypothetical protein